MVFVFDAGRKNIRLNGFRALWLAYGASGMVLAAGLKGAWLAGSRKAVWLVGIRAGWRDRSVCLYMERAECRLAVIKLII